MTVKVELLVLALEDLLLYDFDDAQQFVCRSDNAGLDHFKLWLQSCLEFSNNVLVFFACLNSFRIALRYY